MVDHAIGGERFGLPSPQINVLHFAENTPLIFTFELARFGMLLLLEYSG